MSRPGTRARMPLLALAFAVSATLPGCMGFLGAAPTAAERPRLHPLPPEMWAGEPIPFRVRSPESDDVLWRFGDGAEERGPAVNHTYRDPGLYVVNVTVNGIGETLLVPVHARATHGFTLAGPALADTAPPDLERVPIPLHDAADRAVASFRVLAEPSALGGSSVALRLELPDGTPLSESRALVGAGAGAILTASVPRGRLNPEVTELVLVLEARSGTVQFQGTVEVRTDDPR